MRASISTTVATVLFAVVALSLLSTYLRLSYESTRTIAELYGEIAKLYFTSVWWSAGADRVVLYSSSPVRVLSIILVDGQSVKELIGEFTLDGEYVVDGVSSGKLLVVLEGGKYVVVDPNNPSKSSLPEGLQASARLLPLLAKYLDSQDYLSLVEQYYPADFSSFNIRPHYAPYTTWSTGSSTRYCYSDLLYVHLTWDRDFWYVTYRKCSSDGPMLETLRVPRSSTQIPYREYLYHQECYTSGGVKYCFEVYATARGYCDYGCSTASNSWWYFDVGMRVVYRFEPVEPGKYLVVVLNKTTFDMTVDRGCVTCASYIDYAGSCIMCSNSAGAGWCNINNQQLVSFSSGPRPAFFWVTKYRENLEFYYGDDGYELGSWYPYVEVVPPRSSWRCSGAYCYAVGTQVVLGFYTKYIYEKDYLARADTHQYGYYRVSFDLILDEGGVGTDSRMWDYRVSVILLESAD